MTASYRLTDHGTWDGTNEELLFVVSEVPKSMEKAQDGIERQTVDKWFTISAQGEMRITILMMG
jgi:hypothetical protein